MSKKQLRKHQPTQMKSNQRNQLNLIIGGGRQVTTIQPLNEQTEINQSDAGAQTNQILCDVPNIILSSSNAGVESRMSERPMKGKFTVHKNKIRKGKKNVIN